MLLSLACDTRCGVICWIWLPVCSVYKTCTQLWCHYCLLFLCWKYNLKCASWVVIVIWNVIVFGLKWLLYLFYWLKCDGYFWWAKMVTMGWILGHNVAHFSNGLISLGVSKFHVTKRCHWPRHLCDPVSSHVACHASTHVSSHVVRLVSFQVASTSAVRRHATLAARWHPRKLPSQQPCHISQQQSVTILFCHG
jgi:hypothetical protein